MKTVALVDTSDGAAGSMNRYGDRIEDLWAASGEGTDGWSTKRIRLAGRMPWLAGLGGRVAGWVRHGVLAVRARHVLPRVEADLVHVLDGSYAYVARWVEGTPLLGTVHDVIPLLGMRGVLRNRPSAIGRVLVEASVRQWARMRTVLACSARTAADISAHAGIPGDHIEVVPHWIRTPARPVGDGDDVDAGRRAMRILHVGNNSFYKNRAGVIRVFARVAREDARVELILAGAPPTAALRREASACGVAARTRFVVHPSDAVLDGLYRASRVLLFPSLYEGFGWPPLEAMARGCPVVCSSEGSLPEVVGEAALLRPAADEEGLAHACLCVLHSRSERERLAAEGSARAMLFTEDRVRGAMKRVYGMAMSGGMR